MRDGVLPDLLWRWFPSLWRYPGVMKLLVIASEPITADHLRAAIGPDATDDAEVLVIAPALHKSALRFWLSDADAAIARHPESEQSYRETVTAAEITERFGLPVTVTEIER